jgi:adenylyltransferase/sulfurtransferase
LSADEIRRYSRHLVMPEVGPEGQERLKAARVLVVGAGGLGSPLALYLAAAGVGTLGLAEFDRVDESNLQRQILYGQRDVGRLKIESALERLRQINPLVELAAHDRRLDSSNALEVLDRYDIVADGSDNFATRYLVNDACVLLGKPDVYGSVFRFEGQVSVFWGARGACYRCLFPEPPPPGLVPSCEEGGVLGVLPGIVGSLQALEVIKLALGRDDGLVGRFLVFDGLTMRFRELKLGKAPSCPICSERPSQTGLVDYDELCGAPREAEPTLEPSRDLEPRQLERCLRGPEPPQLVDVRSPLEHAVSRLQGSLLIPLQELPARLAELDRDRDVVLYCHHGVRSARAMDWLLGQGFSRVSHLKGGIDAWSREVDPSVPLY